MPAFRINKKNVMFIHIPKTGGSTLEYVLGQHGHICFFSQQPLSWAPCTPQHFHASILKDLFDFSFFDFVFCVIRDPLNRIKSEYGYRNKLYGRHNLPDFDDWFLSAARRYESNPFLFDNHIRPQSEYICSESKVYFYEDGLENIARDVFRKIGVEPNNFRLPRLRGGGSEGLQISPKVLGEIRRFYNTDYKMGYDVP